MGATTFKYLTSIKLVPSLPSSKEAATQRYVTIQLYLVHSKYVLVLSITDVLMCRIDSTQHFIHFIYFKYLHFFKFRIVAYLSHSSLNRDIQVFIRKFQSQFQLEPSQIILYRHLYFRVKSNILLLRTKTLLIIYFDLVHACFYISFRKNV